MTVPSGTTVPSRWTGGQRLGSGPLPCNNAISPDSLFGPSVNLFLTVDSILPPSQIQRGPHFHQRGTW